MQTLDDIRKSYPQYGDMSDADLAGALHQKFYRDMPRDEFDQRLGLKKVPAAPAKHEETDPYRIEARKEIDNLKAKNIDTGAGYARRIVQGATLNSADEILAALQTPLEMIKRGSIDPREGYRHAKAREDLILEDARDNTGALGTAAEIAGGIGSGTGLARAGLSLVGRLSPQAGIVTKALTAGAEGAGMGGAAGAMEGNTLEERAHNAGLGAALGGAVGAAAPVAASVAKTVGAPVISNIRAWRNPEGFAESQIARGVQESGATPADIVRSVTAAAQEGQPMFTVADAMGNSGQRMLSTTTRAPGRARTDVVEFLDNRQAGQGRRVANQLAEGFDSPHTAAQTRTRLEAARDAQADATYRTIRDDAVSVDLSRVIGAIDDTLRPGVTRMMPQSGIADDSVEGALQRVRDRLTDGRSVLTDFEAIQRARGDLADMITKAHRAGEGNKVRLLTPVRHELDRAMEEASPGFRAANADFRRASQTVDAIDTGRTAALRGRTEDTIPAFRAMRGDQQAAYRAGYVDPLIEAAQTAPFGANKVRPLSNDAFRDEAAAIAPMRTQAQMARQLHRENTMFQTRNTAVGNSKTAENLADDAAMGIDPGLVMNVLSGHYGAAIKSALAAGQNAMTGNTPAVREHVARILLQRGQNLPAPVLQQLLDRTMSRIENVQRIARQLSAATRGGVAVAPEAVGQR